MKAPKGFLAAGAACGLKKSGDPDLALIASEGPCVAAGYFTKNKFAAAPVHLCREHLEKAAPQAVIINSGCANACTGEKGLEDARETARLVAAALDCRPEQVLVASTGVIGEYLAMDKIERGVNSVSQVLDHTGWDAAARAIMTTDTVPKIASVDLEIGGRTITFLGIAKGSGMIHPDLATMLGFVVTDAAISPEALEGAGRRAVENSFNRVTVDGDTSTNDAVIILANGMAENKVIDLDDVKHYHIFEAVLTEVCQVLARKIAEDGEGATHTIEVKVKNAPTDRDAKKVARAVAGSNLVKTAIFGKDANWGRIVCAVGYSGAEFDPDRITVHVGPELIFAQGRPQSASEEALGKLLEEKDVIIHIDLNAGESETTMWTCDFSYDYVKINADYRT